MPRLLCQFAVRGEPIPQGSKSAFRSKSGKLIIRDDNLRLADWRRLVNDAVSEVWSEQPIRGKALGVRAVFLFTRPVSASKRDRLDPWKKTKPDTEKLARAVSDACAKVVYEQDSQLASFEAVKLYADGEHLPGVEVELYELFPADAHAYLGRKFQEVLL